MTVQTIYCTGCRKDVQARLTNGAEMYPNRPDLAKIPFWKCDICGAFVGTHRKSKKHKNRPLGFLATPEVKRWRMLIHQMIDPLWKTGKIERGELYKRLSKALGHDYHTGTIYDAEEGEFVYFVAKMIRDEFDTGPWDR